jgi:hypothetical protein
MTRQDILKSGHFSDQQAQYMLDCEQLCESRYSYETTHPDAANEYEGIFVESGIAASEIDRIEFTTDSDDGLSVFLGNGEIEIQLPRELTREEADFFSRNTDYVVNYPSDKAYIAYPMDLSVKAVLYGENLWK